MPFVWSAVSGSRLHPEAQPPKRVWVRFEGCPQTGDATNFSGSKREYAALRKRCRAPLAYGLCSSTAILSLS